MSKPERDPTQSPIYKAVTAALEKKHKDSPNLVRDPNAAIPEELRFRALAQWQERSGFDVEEVEMVWQAATHIVEGMMESGTPAPLAAHGCIMAYMLVMASCRQDHGTAQELWKSIAPEAFKAAEGFVQFCPPMPAGQDGLRSEIALALKRAQH